MSSTVKLSDTQNFCAPFVNWLDLTAGIDDNPLIGAANLALQTIVSPPFSWPWNRANVEFNATQGVQDYAINIADFGYLEVASVQMLALITSVTVSDGVAVFTAANNFNSLLANGSTPAQISGCTTSALNGTQTIQAATPMTFTCAIDTPDLFEDESAAEALAGPIMSLENKILALTDASEQDRPSFICDLLSSEVALSITKSHTGTFTQGQNGATYPIVVTNTGAAPTSGAVTVTEIPSSGLTFVSMTGTGWTINGMTATRSDVLDPGSSYPTITVAVDVAADAASPQVNQASVAGGGLPVSGAGAIVSASDSTTISPAAMVPYFNSDQNDPFPLTNFGYIPPMTVTAGQFSTIQGTAPGDIKVGDTAILVFMTFGGPCTIDSVQDSLENNWTQLAPPAFRDSSSQLWVFSGAMETAVAVGNTFTIVVNVNGTYDGIERAFVNFGNVSGVDQVATASIPDHSATALVAGPIVTAQPDILFSACIADVDEDGFGDATLPNGYLAPIRHGVEGGQLLPGFYIDYPNLAPVVPAGTYSASWPAVDNPTGGAVVLVSLVARS